MSRQLRPVMRKARPVAEKGRPTPRKARSPASKKGQLAKGERRTCSGEEAAHGMGGINDLFGRERSVWEAGTMRGGRSAGYDAGISMEQEQNKAESLKGVGGYPAIMEGSRARNRKRSGTEYM